MPVQIDEPLLRKISSETGGQYYRSTDNESLQKIYKNIDRLEKTKVEISSYKRYTELFGFYAFFALAFLVLEALLRWTLFRSIT